MENGTEILLGVLSMFMARKKLEQIADAFWDLLLDQIQGRSRDEVLLTEASKIDDRLYHLRERYKADYVFLAIFHNSTKIGLHQYFTVKFDAYRQGKRDLLNQLQKKPLSHYYSLIQKFQTEKTVTITKETKTTQKTKRLLYELQKLGEVGLTASPIYKGTKLIGAIVLIIPTTETAHHTDEARLYIEEQIEGIQESFKKSDRLYHV